MELLEPLVNIGFNEKEAKVYLALLNLNKATAYSVAVRSGLKRTTAYAILDNLVSKGFVLKIPEESKALYFAKSPKECLSIYRERLSEFEEAIPGLMALKKEDEEKITTSYYEGIEEVKEIHKKLLKETSENEYVGFFGQIQDSSTLLGKYFDKLDHDYVKFNIKRRAIITNNVLGKKYSLDGNRLNLSGKLLPENIYNTKVSIEIFKDKTLIFSHKNIEATLIESIDVADAIKQIFEIIWKSKEIIQ